MSESETPLVIGLGEVLWDLFPSGRKPGGAPANVAFQAAQLGGRGAVASRVGTDELGDEIVEYLKARGLELSALQRDPVHATGRVTVDVSDQSHPRYVIHENVAWDFIAADPALLKLAREADAICFGSLAQRSSVSRDSIHAAISTARSDCLIVFDVNLRQDWWDIDGIVRSMRCAQIIKLNHDEVATLAPLLGAPLQVDAFANFVQGEYGVRSVCITRAEHGCLLISGAENIDLPGIRVNVVDAVGAGDAFSAALIMATLRGWPLRSTGELANRVGALVASRPGAMPDIKAELAELWERFRPR
jgi:fructokinase